MSPTQMRPIFEVGYLFGLCGYDRLDESLRAFYYPLAGIITKLEQNEMPLPAKPDRQSG